MSYSDHKKAFKQLKAKPVKLAKFMKHNAPKDRKYGKTTRRCKRCGQFEAHINKYELHVCRMCFREIAISLGFKKYN